MDKYSFDKLTLSLSDSLYRTANSILRNEDEAIDAVQDVLLKLWEIRADLASVDNQKAFVFKALRNKCLDIIKLRKQTIEVDENKLDEDLNPYEQLAIRDTVELVYRLIENLPELQRTVIRMRDVEELEIDEIAFVMGISNNAVSTNLSRARQKIRTQLFKLT